MKKKIVASQHESYGLYTLVALLIPFVGFILGAIMLSRTDKLDRKLGEHVIVMSVLGVILGVILWIAWVNYVAVNSIETIQL